MVVLGDRPTTAVDVVAIARGERVELAASARQRIAAARAVVEAALADHEPVYGLTRELGAGRDTVVDDVVGFQLRVLRNHDAGTGALIPPEQARALIAARLVGFTLGGSGVSEQWADAWAALLNAGVVPAVRRGGSVGAADLTHLAAVARVVAGEGRVLLDGEVVPASRALAVAGLAPVAPTASEALASMSSNAYSIGVGCLVLADAAALPAAADRATALGLAALARHGGGDAAPFDAALHARPDAAASAARIREQLAVPDERAFASRSVQDPVSFRSAPQISGAVAERLDALRAELERELAAPADNPLVASDRLVSGGNFQAASLALAVESATSALTLLATASERRTAILSTLQTPLRRAGEALVPGLLTYGASADTAELKRLAVPVSSQSTPLSAGVEDVAVNTALAVQHLESAVALVRRVLAVEAATAADLLESRAGLAADIRELWPADDAESALTATGALLG